IAQVDHADIGSQEARRFERARDDLGGEIAEIEPLLGQVPREIGLISAGDPHGFGSHHYTAFLQVETGSALLQMTECKRPGRLDPGPEGRSAAVLTRTTQLVTLLVVEQSAKSHHPGAVRTAADERRNQVMDVDVVGRLLSTLPEDDNHPYRTGPWRPQTTEWKADDLRVVEGAIPHDLDGVYLRNTENPLHPAIKNYHPFDGDGMIHVVGFRDGKAFYRNRFVRTDGLLAENEAGKPLWAGMAEMPDWAVREDGWGARRRMKDASSTDVTVHRGRALTSFWQCGDLYRVDPYTAETLGKEDWNGGFPFHWGVSAHPKVDEATGELLFFNYSKEAPYMKYGVVDENNDLVHYIDVPLPGPRLPHDMAFTENYAILNDLPLFWDPALLEHDIHLPRYHRDMPSRFAVIPRRGQTS